MLGNFAFFVVLSADFYILDKTLQNTLSGNNNLVPGQAQCFISLIWIQTVFQRLSVGRKNVMAAFNKIVNIW